MTCRDLESLTTEYLEGALLPPDRIDFETHLAACPECRKRLDEMRALIETSHDLGGKINQDWRARTSETAEQYFGRLRAKVPEKPSSARVRYRRLSFYSVTVGTLIDQFLKEYASKRCRENTQNNYRGLFNNHIRPKWAAEFVQNVKTTAVEDWLESYPHSQQVRSHIRNLMHTLFQAALRWEMVERNPIDLVRQSSKRLKRPRVLTPPEFKALLEMLAEPYKTMAITVACLGLRVSELVALRWGDLKFEDLTVQVARAFVRGAINPTKTDASEGVLPLDPDLAHMLLAYRLQAAYGSDSDYVFANESGDPRWPESMLTDHIKPAATKAGIGNLGWHTFRHTYSTLLHSLGTKPAVQKELLRHANIQTTLNIYTRAISDEKRKAASEVAHKLYEFVPAGKLKSA